MPTVTAGSPLILRLLILAVSFAVGWAGVGYILNRPTTVEAKDGSFSVTHSDYWEGMDLSGFPQIPGFTPDLAIENDESAVFIMHTAAPPGGEQSLQGTFNTAALDQIIATSPWPGKLVSSAFPGTTKIAGKPVALEAKATVKFEGVRGELDLLIAFSPDGTNALLIAHGCATEECSTSTAEFKELLASIEFSGTPQEAH